MKRLLAGVVTSGIALSLFLLYTPVGAQIVTSSGVWYRKGAAMLLNPSTLTVGSAAEPIEAGYFKNLFISPGTCTGCGSSGGGGASTTTVNTWTALQTFNALAITGANNSVLATDSTGRVGATSTPTAAAFFATSTTATSTYGGSVQIGATTGDNALKITAARDYPASQSVGGMVNLTNTLNAASALTIYTNHGASASAPLIKVRNDNSAYDQEMVTLQSLSDTRTTLGVESSSTAQGTVKITHHGGGITDPNASALSIDLAGAGTQAQGIFMTSTTGGTTGALMELRNNLLAFGGANAQVSLLTLKGTGFLGLASSTPGSIFAIDGVANFVTGATSTIYTNFQTNAYTQLGTTTTFSFNGTIYVDGIRYAKTQAGIKNAINACSGLAPECTTVDLLNASTTFDTTGIDLPNNIRITSSASSTLGSFANNVNKNGIFNIRGKNNIKIDHLNFVVGYGGSAITNYGGDNISIDSSDFTGTTTNYFIWYNGFAGQGGVATSTNFSITNSNFHDAPNSQGSIVYQTYTYGINYPKVTYNTFRQTGGPAVLINSTATTTGLLVDHNNFLEMFPTCSSTFCPAVGLLAGLDSAYKVIDTTFSNNYYIMSSTTADGSGGIWIYQSYNTKILNNTLIGPQHYDANTVARNTIAIAPGRVNGPDIGLIIQGNYFRGWGALWDPDSMQDVDVSGNVAFDNNTGWNLGYNIQKNVHVHDNVMHNSVQSGSYMTGAQFGCGVMTNVSYERNHSFDDTASSSMLSAINLVCANDFSTVIVRDNDFYVPSATATPLYHVDAGSVEPLISENNKVTDSQGVHIKSKIIGDSFSFMGTTTNTTHSVGIGTTTPWAALSIAATNFAGPQFSVGSTTSIGFTVDKFGRTTVGGSHSSGASIIGNPLTINANASNNMLQFTNSAGTDKWQIDYQNTNDLDFTENGVANYRLLLKAGGNVGMGTSSPGSLLSVGNTAGINFTTATSTFATGSGINLTGGCFAVNNTCISSSGGVSLSAANTWTALQQFQGGASTTALSVYNNAWFGATATSSFNSTGQLTLANLPNALLSTNAAGQVIATSTPTAFAFFATSTSVASQLPFASSTSFTASGKGFFNSLLVGGTFTDTTPSSLNVDQNGSAQWISLTTGSANVWRLANSASGINFSEAGVADYRLFVHQGGGIGIDTSSLGSKLSVSGNESIGATFSALAAPTNGLIVQGTTGVGTSTPFALLSVAGASLGTTPLFAVSSSTATATGTAMIIDSNGNVGIGTTTPGSILAIQGVGNLTSGTSTLISGLNIKSGCFSIAGTCVTGSGSGVTGGVNGMMAAFTGATTLTPTSTLVMENIIGTSTVATSTLAGPVQMGATAGDNFLKMTAARVYPASVTTGGMVNLTNTLNDGAGLVLVSAHGSGATGRLFAVNCSGSAFDQDCAHIDHAGPADALSISDTNTNTASNAISITGVGGNTLNVAYNGVQGVGAASFTSVATTSTMSITGPQSGQGTVKITHNATTSDANASALSLDAATSTTVAIAPTAAQVLFLNSTGSTTGNIITGRNNNIDYFTFNSTGWLGIGTTSPSGVLATQGRVFHNAITAFAAGDGNAACFRNGGELVIDSGVASCIISSGFVKKNIQPNKVEEARARLKKLNVKTFEYIDSNKPDIGLIAEEAAVVDVRYAQYTTTPRDMDGHHFNVGDPIAINWSAIQADMLTVQQADMGAKDESPKMNWNYIVYVGGMLIAAFVASFMVTKRYEK